MTYSAELWKHATEAFFFPLSLFLSISVSFRPHLEIHYVIAKVCLVSGLYFSCVIHQFRLTNGTAAAWARAMTAAAILGGNFDFFFVLF